jgi:hypothetical protein
VYVDILEQSLQRSVNPQQHDAAKAASFALAFIFSQSLALCLKWINYSETRNVVVWSRDFISLLGALGVEYRLKEVDVRSSLEHAIINWKTALGALHVVLHALEDWMIH